MNKNFTTILTTAAVALVTVCTHCDGTGIEPLEELLGSIRCRRAA